MFLHELLEVPVDDSIDDGVDTEADHVKVLGEAVQGGGGESLVERSPDREGDVRGPGDNEGAADKERGDQDLLVFVPDNSREF